MPKQLPEETPASASARAALSADWLNPSAFKNLLRLYGSTGQTLRQLTESGSVLGVWLPEEKEVFYPAWQLTLSNEPVTGVAELLSLLRGPYGVAKGERTSGWEDIEWLTAEHALLGGSSPSMMLATDPDLVLEVARQHFSSWSVDASW